MIFAPQIDGATGQRYTFGELEAICESIAAGFQDLGLQPGDTVCFVSPNTVDLITAFIATAFAGGVIACVKTVFNESEK